MSVEQTGFLALAPFPSGCSGSGTDAAPRMSSSLFQVEFALGNLLGNQNKILLGLEEIYWLFGSVSPGAHTDFPALQHHHRLAEELEGRRCSQQSSGDGQCEHCRVEEKLP